LCCSFVCHQAVDKSYSHDSTPYVSSRRTIENIPHL
jgi:hypothetical protein